MSKINLDMISDVRDRYILARWCYSIPVETTIGDDDYNYLHRFIKDLEVLPEYTSRSWSSDPCPVELLRKYNLETLMRDIVLVDKTESIPSINNMEDLDREFRYATYPLVISFKHDGWNIRISYINGKYVMTLTRGRSADSMDVSKISIVIPEEIYELLKQTIVSELTLSKESYMKLKIDHPEKNLTSIRNAVSAAIALDGGEKYLSVTAFDILEETDMSVIMKKLKEFGFNTPYFSVVNSYEELLDAITEYSNMKEAYPYPTDGLVVRSINGDYKRALRVKAWEEGIYESYVVDYLEEPSRHYFNFRAKVFPIKLENSKHEIVNLTNLNRAIDFNIDINSPIAFRMTSSSYPDIDVTATKYLQNLYSGRYNEFIKKVQEGEELKKSEKFIAELTSRIENI